jgi:uncharacterized protein (DUF2336 family)
MRIQPLLDELEAALAFGSDTRRVDMLSRIADLFVNGAPHYSEEQVALFDDVMMRLLDTTDAKARAELAQRLAPISNAPNNVIHTLAFDDAIVAQPVLIQSERISDAEILASAASKSQPHLAAIAQRKTLSEPLTDVLAERGDRNVVQLAVKNPGARFSDAGLHLLVRRATGDQALAAEMGKRGDIRQWLAEKAARAERARLVAEQMNARAVPQETGDEPADGDSGGRKASLDFTAARAEVERQNRVHPIGDAEVYLYARDRKFAETAAALSLLCDTPFEVVERALLDPGAELVLVLAKVAGLSPATTRVILLLRAADRGISSDAIEQALASFERLQPEAAQRVLSFFRARAKMPPEPEAPPAFAANG